MDCSLLRVLLEQPKDEGFSSWVIVIFRKPQLIFLNFLVNTHRVITVASVRQNSTQHLIQYDS